MARMKGSKNKPKITEGNPDFNLKDAVSFSTRPSDIAAAAIMPEDLEFERHLASLNTEMPPDISDPDPPGAFIKKEIERREMLGEKPASTDDELRYQIHSAKINGCDSIEATEALAKRFCRDPLLMSVGYFIYHDIKVYVVGSTDKAMARDRMTIEARNFGAKV